MGGNGAVAPHAAMTKTGHQAQRNVVNPADTDADVVTAFHPDSETERTLLFGSNFVEIQPSTAASTYGSSQTFTFSNDVDAIGDVYARVILVGSTASVKAELLARIIDRVEVMVGNSTWQTLENADLIALYRTSMDYGSAVITNLQANGDYQAPRSATISGSTITGGVENIGGTAVDRELWLPLNIFTAGGPKRAHLVAGAPHQSFRVKLTYRDPGSALGGDPKVELWARQHIMTNFERDQIRSNTIAKTLNLTQHMDFTASSSSKNLNIECDSFSLLASHLLITLESEDGGTVDPGAFESAELLLNTSSHSGQLDAGFMMAATGSSMGLPNFVPNVGPSLADSDQYQSGAIAGTRAVFVFPIAATPWGPDGCPFNRFDTIRLKLAFSQAFQGHVSVTCCGTASAVYAKQAASLQYHS